MNPSFFFNNSICNHASIYSSTPPPQPQPQQTLYPNSNEWTFKEDKTMEIAFAKYHESPELFKIMALELPGKSIDQIKEHLNILFEDVHMIDSGDIPLPYYKETSAEKGKKLAVEKCHQQLQRKKGVPWTKREHGLFLAGLEKYGKGDWRSISRHFVVTRTPTQVASHAQKHFLKIQNANSASRSKKGLTSEAASTDMAMAPSPHLSGPSAAISMADIIAHHRYYQNQS